MAMSIMLVFMPLLGIVFYQITVLPPDNSMKLSINDEVGQIAAMIYQDGYMADNFTLGTGPVGVYPYYYGNFSWIDYSTTPPNQYVVSYYYTNNCTGNSYCNHIVRQLNVTQVQPTPTPTPTPTGATPTPSPIPTASPTPTPTPIPTAYTYCTGGGTDKWAYGRTWLDGYTINYSSLSPSDFMTFNQSDPRLNSYTFFPLYTASSSEYLSMCNADSSYCAGGDVTTYWLYTNSTNPMCGVACTGNDSELFTFKTYQDRSTVTDISIFWRGHGDPGLAAEIFSVALKIWDYQHGSWNTLLCEQNNLSNSYKWRCFNNVSYSITAGLPGCYIESGTGNVSILATAARTSIAGEGIYTDYIELDVQ